MHLKLFLVPWRWKLSQNIEIVKKIMIMMIRTKTKTEIYFLRSHQSQSRLAVGSSDRCALCCLREDVRWTDRYPTGTGPNMCRGWKGTRLLRGRQRGPAHAGWRRIPEVLPAGGGFLRGPALRLGKSARCLHRDTLLPGLDTRQHGAIVLKM